MSEHHHHDHDLESEAQAFNERIEERTAAGFIPDLRRSERVEFFYKSFWRDPVFTDLYVGEMYRNYSRFIKENIGAEARILDAGCGAGYFALELARDGHQVVGIDIAEKNIAKANQMLEENQYTDGFGSLDYHVASVEEFLSNDEYLESFDVVLFSGVLHHLEELKGVLSNAKSLLKRDGIVITHEPCHEGWTESDASVVALIRSLLSLAGHWYEDIEEMLPDLNDQNFDQYIKEIKTEYVEERDKHERGQSPHDNTFNGEQILLHLNEEFSQLEVKKSSSFIYRVLGGVRASNIESEREIAKLLTIFDQYAVKSGLLNPNYFYYCGQKK